MSNMNKLLQNVKFKKSARRTRKRKVSSSIREGSDIGNRQHRRRSPRIARSAPSSRRADVEDDARPYIIGSTPVKGKEIVIDATPVKNGASSVIGETPLKDIGDRVIGETPVKDSAGRVVTETPMKKMNGGGKRASSVPSLNTRRRTITETPDYKRRRRRRGG